MSSTNFAEEELQLMKTVLNNSVLNENDIAIATSGTELYQEKMKYDECISNYDRAYKSETKDKMFCLNMPQLVSAIKNFPDIYRVTPTRSAVENSEYKSNDIGVDKVWSFWLTEHQSSFKTKDLYHSFSWDEGKNKTCYYKVRAYKKVGGKTIYGPYSETIKIK